MTSKPVREPDANHSIEIARLNARVEIHFNGAIVARSERAVEMRESSYPPVLYIPPSDVEERYLRASTHTSYCPYKGDARYHSLNVGGIESENAAWSYPSAHPAVAAIEGYLAFYAERVERITCVQQ